MNGLSLKFAYLSGKGFFDLLSARFLVQFLGFGTILLVARLLNPVELGEIKIIQTYSSLFLIVAGFGIHAAVLKICSEQSSVPEKEKVLKYAVKRSLCTSLLTFILLACLAHTGVITSTIHTARWLVIYSIILPFSVMSEIFMVFLQAQKRIKVMARVQAVVKIQAVGIVVFATWKWGFSGFIISTITASVMGLIPLMWQVGLQFWAAARLRHVPRFANFAIYSTLGTLVSQIGQRGDIMLLDHLVADREALGYYSLATIFVMAALQVTGSVQQIVTPYFSEHSRDFCWVAKHWKINTCRMIALSVVVALGVFLVAAVLLQFFFPPQYIVTLSCLSVLLIKYVVYSSYAIGGAMLLGLGYMKANFICVAISTPISLIIMYFSLKEFGINGLLWAAVGSSLITCAISYTIVWYVFKILRYRAESKG